MTKSSALFLFAVSLSLTAAGDDSDKPQETSTGTLERARQIVETYTPQKRLWVRAFENGLRVSGITVESQVETPSPASSPEYEAGFAPPPWFDESSILGTLKQNGTQPVVKVLWKVLPVWPPASGVQNFSIELVHHLGYSRQEQEPPPVSVSTDDHDYGTVFWTEHKLPPLRMLTPGLYDLFVSSTSLPRDTIALGQVLCGEWVESQADTRRHINELFPQGHIIFAGDAALTRWYSFRFPVPGLSFKPTALAVFSTANWLEQEANLAPVAEIQLSADDRQHGVYTLRLGRDTSSAWYDFHARGGELPQERAPIAWSTHTRHETIDFESNVYVAQFDLEPGAMSPTHVKVKKTGDKGVLRLRGIVFLP